MYRSTKKTFPYLIFLSDNLEINTLLIRERDYNVDKKKNNSKRGELCKLHPYLFTISHIF